MAYKITGRVLHVGTPQTFNSKSGNQFVKRDVVIMVRKFDQYTGEPTFDELNTPKFSFMNEKCQQLDQIRVGFIVTINFDLRGRAYKKDERTEYITDVSPFSIVADRTDYQVHQQLYQQPYDQVQQPPVQPQPSYQQPVAPLPQQQYSHPSQQNVDRQQYTSPINVQDSQIIPQNKVSGDDEDLPF